MAEPQKIRFYYIKSNAFRVVHADGVFGGVTPGGLIHASFWSERLPIPTYVEHSVDTAAGKLGEEIGRDGRTGARG